MKDEQELGWYYRAVSALVSAIGPMWSFVFALLFGLAALIGLQELALKIKF